MSSILADRPATDHIDLRTKTMVRASGRSWWQARYRDGKTLAEWETVQTKSGKLFNDTVQKFLPGPVAGRTSRWEEVPKKGMVALRLLCPNGNGGVLDSPVEQRFFQLKAGMFDLGPNKTFCEAHIIGVVLSDDETCMCWSWEPRNARLVKFQDNVHNMAYRQIGRLALPVLGVRLAAN